MCCHQSTLFHSVLNLVLYLDSELDVLLNCLESRKGYVTGKCFQLAFRMDVE